MKQIPLSQGKFAVVDAADYDFLMQWKWCTTRSGTLWYAVRGGDGRKGSFICTTLSWVVSGLITSMVMALIIVDKICGKQPLSKTIGIALLVQGLPVLLREFLGIKDGGSGERVFTAKIVGKFFSDTLTVWCEPDAPMTMPHVNYSVNSPKPTSPDRKVLHDSTRCVVRIVQVYGRIGDCHVGDGLVAKRNR